MISYLISFYEMDPIDPWLSLGSQKAMIVVHLEGVWIEFEIRGPFHNES